MMLIPLLLTQETKPCPVAEGPFDAGPRRAGSPTGGTAARWAGRIAALLLLGSASSSLMAQGDDSFTPIFDGETLNGWVGQNGIWRVEGGAIIGETTSPSQLKANTFLIWEQAEVADFELRFRYRIASEQANSGIQVRSEWRKDLGDGYVLAGPQPDIATVDWITGIHYEERGRGILARRGQRTVIGPDGERETTRFAEEAELQKAFDQSEWTDYHVIARGDTLVSRINGQTMHEVVDRSPQARRSGHIGFQIHTGPAMRLEFKDIELKRLPLADGKRQVVMIAGDRSHGYMAHEHNAGLLLFERLLREHYDGLEIRTYLNGWPKDPTAFDHVDGVVIYANGGPNHPVMENLEMFDALMQKGVGLAAFHYAVEIPVGVPGDYFVDWLGGYFATHWSVNPHWVLEDPEVATTHPIGYGVEPYEIDDEWYFHMRFREGMSGVTPILSAHPPQATMQRGNGPHSGNPDVRAALERGEIQHVVWAAERENGGRGFGFTGGHWHYNWAHPMQRKLALNAIAWISGADVPAQGIVTPPLTLEDLEANQDYAPPPNFDRQRIESLLEAWAPLGQGG